MKKILFVIALVFIVFVNQTKASHFAGSDISFKYFGGNVYKISVTFYRDCSGIIAPPTLAVTAHCDSNPVYNFSVNLLQIPQSTTQLNAACISNQSTCNGGNSYGVEKYVYEATATFLPGQIWTISNSSNTRNTITTVYNNNANSWYIYATINTSAGINNSSTTFTNEPKIIAYNGYYTEIDLGLFDINGDSLSVSFINPMTNNKNTNVVYVPPYSYTNFLSSSTPISINQQTGIISFTPTVNLLTMYAIKIEEWRKVNGVPVLVGTSMRDMQINIITGQPQMPELSGMNFNYSNVFSSTDTTYYAEMCLGQMIYFTINGRDLDTMGNNKFTLENLNPIPNTVFTIYNNHTDSAFAQFSWFNNDITTVNNVTCLYVSIEDYDCPYKNKVIKQYCIKTLPPLLPPNIGNDTTICVNHQLLLDAGPANSYLWFNGDTSQTIIVDASILGVGNHKVEVEIEKNGCYAKGGFNLIVDPCTGIDNLNQLVDIQLNPNPTNGLISLTVNQGHNENYSVEIWNSSGQVIYSNNLILSANSPFIIDLSKEPIGIYYAKFTGNQFIIAKKIILL